MTYFDYADIPAKTESPTIGLNRQDILDTCQAAPVDDINDKIDAIRFGTMLGFCFRAIIAFHIALIGIACVVFGVAALIAAIFLS